MPEVPDQKKWRVPNSSAPYSFWEGLLNSSLDDWLGLGPRLLQCEATPLWIPRWRSGIRTMEYNSDFWRVGGDRAQNHCYSLYLNWKHLLFNSLFLTWFWTRSGTPSVYFDHILSPPPTSPRSSPSSYPYKLMSCPTSNKKIKIKINNKNSTKKYQTKSTQETWILFRVG